MVLWLPLGYHLTSPDLSFPTAQRAVHSRQRVQITHNAWGLFIGSLRLVLDGNTEAAEKAAAGALSDGPGGRCSWVWLTRTVQGGGGELTGDRPPAG